MFGYVGFSENLDTKRVVLALGYIDGWVRSVWISMKKGDLGRTRDKTLEAGKNKL